MSNLYNFFCSIVSAQEVSEIDYEREFEKKVNEFVWGPKAFHIMMNNSAEPFHLSTEVARLTQAIRIMSVATESEQIDFGQAFEQTLTIPNEPPPPYVEQKPEYRPVTSMSSPSLPEYFVAMAQTICPELLDNKTLITKDRVDTLKALAKSDLIRRCPTEVERFLKLHTPYYFVRKMADKLEAFLNSEDVTDEAIEKILTSYGVTDLDLYRVDGMSTYNIHHIKFSLLEIAFNACIKDKILLSINDLKERHPWRYDPHNNYNPTDKQGWIIAFEWSINEIYMLGIKESQERREVGAESYARNDVTNTTLALGGVKASGSASNMFSKSKKKADKDDADADAEVETKAP